MTDLLLVYCSCPDLACAKRLAHLLLEQRLAACVSLLPNLTSFYHWQGNLQETSELLLLIKTDNARYAAVESLLSTEHPYQVPEIIAVPVSQGLPDYIRWVTQNDNNEAITLGE